MQNKFNVVSTALMVLTAVITANADPLPYNHFDLGVGSYGSNYHWCNGTELDIARQDWCVVGIGNESADMSTVDRINGILKINPKFKVVIRTWPRCTYRRSDDPKGSPARTVWMLDYRYYPEAREAFLKALIPQIRIFVDNLINPDAVYGYTIYEELPHHFCNPYVSFITEANPGTKCNEALLGYAAQYERETGKKMDEWNEDVRVWWSKAFAAVMQDIFASVRKELPKVRSFMYLMTQYRPLDWLDEGESVHSSNVIACKWSDLVKPGVYADGFFCYNNCASWTERYHRLARENGWPFFTQLSHTGSMRIDTWENCLAYANADLKENLGYFFYSPDFVYGEWNDDPDVLLEDTPKFAGMYNRTRRVLAKLGVGMDIVRRELVPELFVDYDLGAVGETGYGCITVYVRNARTKKWFPFSDEAVLKNVKVRLTLPKGFTFVDRTSVGPEILIPELKAGEMKHIMWWPRRDSGTSVDGPLPVKIEVTCDGVRPLVYESEAKSHHDIWGEVSYLKDSGEFRYVNWRGPGWNWRWREMTIECLKGELDHPSICGMSAYGRDTRIRYDGVMKPGERLVISPDAKTAKLFGKKDKVGTDVSDKMSGEPIMFIRGITTLRYIDNYYNTGLERVKITISPEGILPARKKK